MKITVIGCGKIGLPLMLQAASKGNFVFGVDINQALVDAINRGDCPISEPDIAGLLKEALGNGLLKATTDIAEAVADSDAVIVIVPALLDADYNADLSAVISVTEHIARSVKPGAIISYETTLPVGTTRNILAPILSRSGKVIDRDIYLVYSPERVKSLRVMEKFRTVPKLVGGAGPNSLRKGLEFYQSILDAKIIDLGDLESAEMAKLMDMIYRDVNIGLVNEFARYADMMGIDIQKIIPAVNTHEEAHLHQPGIGVGGHCTPVYPHFLIHDARRDGFPITIAERARHINHSQPEYVIGRLENELGGLKGKKILLLGLAFRPDVREDSYSPSYLLRQAAGEKGASVFLDDPLYTDKEIMGKGFNPLRLYVKEKMDVIILVTAHNAFASIDWGKARESHQPAAVYDGRNAILRGDVEKEGMKYIGVGGG